MPRGMMVTKTRCLSGAGVGEVGDDDLSQPLPWPAGTLLRIWGRRMSRNAGVDGKVSIWPGAGGRRRRVRRCQRWAARFPARDRMLITVACRWTVFFTVNGLPRNGWPLRNQRSLATTVLCAFTCARNFGRVNVIVGTYLLATSARNQMSDGYMPPFFTSVRNGFRPQSNSLPGPIGCSPRFSLGELSVTISTGTNDLQIYRDKRTFRRESLDGISFCLWASKAVSLLIVLHLDTARWWRAAISADSQL